MIETLTITPGASLECPDCQEKEFLVIQFIKRHSKLIRVDGFGDLLVEPPDVLSYEEALQLSCLSCGAKFRVVETCEAWNQQEAERVYDVPERITNDDQVDLW